MAARMEKVGSKNLRWSRMRGDASYWGLRQERTWRSLRGGGLRDRLWLMMTTNTAHTGGGVSDTP